MSVPTSASSRPGLVTDEEDLPALAPIGERSGSWCVARSDLRACALSWTERRRTLRFSDAVAWTLENLVAPGFLMASHGTNPLPFLWERDVGLIRTDAKASTEEAAARHPAEAAGFVLRASEFPRLLEVAHARVRRALRGLIERNGNDAFVHAALYARRVWREPLGGKRFRWGVRMTCDVPMSDQVLSLFAADLLTHRDAYDQDLAVCEECGAIAFEPSLPHWRRFGCMKHPDPLRREETLLRT